MHTLLSIMQDENRRANAQKALTEKQHLAPSTALNGGVGMFKTSLASNPVTQFQRTAHQHSDVYLHSLSVRLYTKVMKQSKGPRPCR